VPTMSMAQTSGTTTGLITSDPDSHWLVSGFVGSNFAMNASPGSADFGGSIGYLFKDKVGAELVTGFTRIFNTRVRSSAWASHPR